jgi:hypothetical protein
MAALYKAKACSPSQPLAEISAALQTMNGEIVREGKKVEVFHQTTT